MSKKADANEGSLPGSTVTPEFDLRLFVTGASPHSARAISNIKKICEAHLKGRYSLQIVDVYQQAALLQKEEIVALPMLVKQSPLPKRKMIGDLSDTSRVLRGLGLID